MICPRCDGPTRMHGKVYNGDEDELYRRQICKKCGHMFYTVEFEVEVNDKLRKEWRKHGGFTYKKGDI